MLRLAEARCFDLSLEQESQDDIAVEAKVTVITGCHNDDLAKKVEVMGRDHGKVLNVCRDTSIDFRRVGPINLHSKSIYNIRQNMNCAEISKEVRDLHGFLRSHKYIIRCEVDDQDVSRCPSQPARKL